MSSEATKTSLCMEFPLRPGYLAQVIIPRDMTRLEASRLCAYVMALAQPETCQGCFKPRDENCKTCGQWSKAPPPTAEAEKEMR